MNSQLQWVKSQYREKITPFIRDYCTRLSRTEADKIMRQINPSAEEWSTQEGFLEDPLEEESENLLVAPGLIRKYPGKVLYLTHDRCPVYCRFCTRKRKTLKKGLSEKTELDKAIAYIRTQPAIREVILSGGDPLVLPVRELRQVFNRFISMSQIKFLRIHTRALTMDPVRTQEMFLETLTGFSREARRLGKVFAIVAHINTAVEISSEAARLFESLSDCKLYSQSVLLKGINDSVEDLESLLWKIQAVGVQPYYMHMLDRVEGAAHFEVEEAKAIELMNELRNRLPPYLLPRLIRDSPTGKQNYSY